MKHRAFLAFFAVVLIVHSAVNFYIYVHGLNAFAPDSPWRLPYTILFIALASSFIGARFLQRVWLSRLTEWMDWFGAFWLGAMVYFLFALVLIDVAQLLDGIVAFLPRDAAVYASLKQVVFAAVVALVGITVIAGHINARMPRIRELDLTIPKRADGTKTFTIVAASDIHLGTIIHNRRLVDLVRRMNALNPDLILLPGDVFDEDIGAVIRQNQGDTLRTLRARHGVFAITGNHEYIGGAEQACAYLEQHGVTVLRDRWVRVAGMTIVGREDRASTQFAGKQRMPLDELMRDVDHTAPVILMDHQPFHLEEAEQNRVDLQLSGHTHHGQLWPFGFITKKIYEMSWGYVKKGDTHVYVSCGYGTWGPPIRTGNRPEIVKIVLHLGMPEGSELS